MNVFNFFSLTTFFNTNTKLYAQLGKERTDFAPITGLRFVEDDSQIGLVIDPKGKALTLEQVQTRLSQVGQKAQLFCLVEQAPRPVLGFHQDESGVLVLK
ncbi:hypothetical protein G6R29_05565 [Fructobacillus sp. M2-14]|uniref:Uncharacterized protein n=1 Tax=Fructobacillus broussonetiae TaxID=2713173 RepID=A0ABS5R4L3_9LACO|nr:hypothetical protein [Fructobacillus broussonetiae]MBS9339087.1 hypothetical protein [Fructobacillus broussonetiae]